MLILASNDKRLSAGSLDYVLEQVVYDKLLPLSTSWCLENVNYSKMQTVHSQQPIFI